MKVEITGYSLEEGYLIIYATNLDAYEDNVFDRNRIDDPDDYAVEFHFDTKNDPVVCAYVSRWLHANKACKGSKNYGEALRAIIGTVTILKKEYLQFRAA